MRNERWVKKEFMRRWMSGVKKYRWEEKKKTMSLMERKKAIKVCADVAMASTRDKSTRWSRALIAKAASSSDETTKVLTQHVVGCSYKALIIRRRRLMKSIRRRRRVACMKVKEKERLAVDRKRRRKLTRLLPGGDDGSLKDVDDVSLIEETLDYVQSLSLQVQLMRALLTLNAPTIHHPF